MKLNLYNLSVFVWFFTGASLIYAQQNMQRNLVQRERTAALRRLLQQPLANTGNYDITYHRLELQPQLDNRNLTGEVTTYFVANNDLIQMEFDFNTQMQVNSVIYHGSQLNFNQSNNRLIINFLQPILQGNLDSIKITYDGFVPDTGLGSYAVSTHNGKPVVWTLSEPYGARDWWPCKQDLTDKIDSVDVILKYPKIQNGVEMVGVSNGILTSENITQINGTDYKISTWKHRYPIAAYLVAFAVTNYTKFSQTAGIVQNFPIDNYVYPENLSLAQIQSNAFVPVMNFFEQSFGHYPFYTEKYGQIQFGWGGGMEHQTATFVANYQRWLIAHELAHQWFGDAITCGSWHDIWLNEGFATYSEALIKEHLDGQTEFDNWKQNAVSAITQYPDGSVYVQDTTDVWRIFDSRLSYYKGAMVLNMLRLQVGDSDFFEGLRNYVNQKSFQYAKTQDFKAIIETQSGKDLTDFFNDWIYGEGYPTYSIQVTRTGAQEYEVVINQTTSHASVSFFELSLPFVFKDDNGHELQVMLQNTINGQHFVVQTGFDVTDVIFDPHHDIIHRNSTLNMNLDIKTFENQTFKIYPNPVKHYLYMDSSLLQPVSELKILSVDGKELRTYSYQNQPFDVDFLPAGVYWLQFRLNRYTYLQKFVKQ